MMFADRVTQVCEEKQSRLVVGLDPHEALFPASYLEQAQLETTARIFDYMARVVDASLPYAAAFKPQAAFFERHGLAGWRALELLLKYLRDRGAISILDGKRNDIGSTAEAYADAYFDRERAAPMPCDALTLNPYLGFDGIKPFLRAEQGLFVLVKTSNPSSGDFQDLRLANGETLAEQVAQALERWTADAVGVSGLGNLGAVVGATYPEHMKKLRTLMPRSIFLVPGYGAQGGSLDAVRAAFLPGGKGALINSSRGICFPKNFLNFASVAQAAKAARDEINSLIS